jgi:hypothetical protein
MRRSPLLRFPDLELLNKLRVVALTTGVSCGDILVRLSRGGIEAEFSQLPPGVRRMARRPFKLAGTGPRGKKKTGGKS